MSTLPSANYLNDNARTEGEFKAGLEAMLAATKQIPGAGVPDLALTIAAGSITPAGSGGVLVVETESLATSDDLTNIIQTNYPDRSMLMLRNNNAARFVVVKHAATGSGQIFLDRSVDYVLDDTNKYLLLQRRGTDWYEIGRWPNRFDMPVVTKTASFTIQREDRGKVFLCTGGGGGLTVSFAAAATLGAGFCVSIINNHSLDNVVTLDPNGAERVDERTNLLLSKGRGALVVCDGVDFWTLGNRVKPRIVSYNYSATLNINFSDADWLEVAPLTGNVTTLNVDAELGSRSRIRFKQDGTGGRTVANPAGSKITGSIDTAANKVSYLDLYYAVQDLRLEGFWSTVPV